VDCGFGVGDFEHNEDWQFQTNGIAVVFAQLNQCAFGEEVQCIPTI